MNKALSRCIRWSILSSAFVVLPNATFGYDVDVTFIDRLPNYAYDAPKNKPADGDPVTFVGHVKLEGDSPLEVPYKWFLDGVELASGTVTLQPGADNTVSTPWTWDSGRHEIMFAINIDDAHLEESDQNNILFDFTDGLIVGVAVEESLVAAFPAFQEQLQIGSRSFEDWFQRMIRIWNLMFAKKATTFSTLDTLDLKDRVRGVLSYHPDGSLAGGNCPLAWKEVDMLWGKLASDVEWYSEGPANWFYEWALPHELTHARYLPDTYVYDIAAAAVEIIDDSGLPVVDTEYMPKFSWDIVYYNNGRNSMMGGYGTRYDLFSGYLWNRMAGERSAGCNTNGCCGHNTNWPNELPADMYIQLTGLSGNPRVNARLDIYTRVGAYWPYSIDNIIDFTLFTDSSGKALLPDHVFLPSGEFVMKITSSNGSAREYRFVERTDFHAAHWGGQTESYHHAIRTDFDLPPIVDNVSGEHGERGGTVDLIFVGSNFIPGQYVRFGDPDVVVNEVTWVSSNEARVNATLPSDLFQGPLFLLYNPDGKFTRVSNPYQGGVNLQFPDARPYARYLTYEVGEPADLRVYFNGLWSDDWSKLYHSGGNYPQPGTGPIASYHWDFGDGTSSTDPFVVHQFPERGYYSVSLTVTDQDDLTDTMTEVVPVNIVCLDDDEDGYGTDCYPGQDCDDADPNNWNSCASCVDMDSDGYYVGCDAYSTINGPDCDDLVDTCIDDCTSDVDFDSTPDCADACLDADGDGYGSAGGAGNSCPGTDCDDADPNNWTSCVTCVDDDSDSYYVACDAYLTISGPDCDDGNAGAVALGSAEINDGLDNHCPSEQGHGLVDEIEGESGFGSPGDKDEFSWSAQPGATLYEVSRSYGPAFANCVDAIWQTSGTSVVDDHTPLSGWTFYYLVRAIAPNTGSWGGDSLGGGRAWVCGEWPNVNFSLPSSATPPGFLKDDGALFDPARGYGWDSSVSSRERNSSFPLELNTFVKSVDERTWEMELPNGDYAVRLACGDASYPQGPQRVRLQGMSAMDDVMTQAGEFVPRTMKVPVRGGRLAARIGGAGGQTTLNLFEVVELPSVSSTLHSVNFQPGGATVSDGWLKDDGSPFDAGRGYGWNDTLSSRERNRRVAQVLDTFVRSVNSRAWELELANGSYDVWLSVGDAAFAQGPQRVWVEGMPVVEDEMTAINDYLERRTEVEVIDGRLTVEIGGAGGWTTLNYVTVEAAGDAL